jgi:hypothetical protein
MVVPFTKQLQEPENQDKVLLELLSFFEVIHFDVYMLFVFLFLIRFIIADLLERYLLDYLVVDDIILIVHILLNIHKVRNNHLLQRYKKVIEAILLEVVEERFLGLFVAAYQ